MMTTTGEQIWQATLNELQLVLTPENYNTWLSGTRVVDDENGTLSIGVPKAFHKDWLENKLNGRIVTTMQRLGHGQRTVRYVVVPNGAGPASGMTVPRRQREVTQSRGNPAMSLFEQQQSALGPDYVFETFIVGASNRLTHAAAVAVAEDPGGTWNPLFIWGGVGLGKTHLLHAIGHKVHQNRPEKAVVYVTCERFTNDMIEAIRTGQTPEFRDRYRTVDVLLIDDIQFLAGRESTQEEFFHTFNELHLAHKQIVLTSDRKPNAMSTLEERLRSRFEWGLITEVDMPDLETRVAILRAKAEKQKVPVHPAAIEYIARRVGQSNIRDLQGVLNKVTAMAILHGVPVTEKLAAEALDSLAPSHKRKVTAAEVLNVVAQYYKLDLAALQGPARDRGVALPRQIAMYLMREESDASLPGIGTLLGNRDHSTVMHGCDKINRELRNENPQLRSDVRAIRAMLYETR